MLFKGNYNKKSFLIFLVHIVIKSNQSKINKSTSIIKGTKRGKLYCYLCQLC